MTRWNYVQALGVVLPGCCNCKQRTPPAHEAAPLNLISLTTHVGNNQSTHLVHTANIQQLANNNSRHVPTTAFIQEVHARIASHLAWLYYTTPFLCNCKRAILEVVPLCEVTVGPLT